MKKESGLKINNRINKNEKENRNCKRFGEYF